MRRWSLGIAAILAGASVLVAWGLWHKSLGGRTLQDELAAARREGLAVEPRDLVVAPIPDAENGAIPYLRAIEYHRRRCYKTSWFGDYQKLLPYRRTHRTLSASERKQMHALLDIFQPAFDDLRDATKRPGFALNRRWDKLDSDLVPDAFWHPKLVRALASRAELSEAEGNLPSAFDGLLLAAQAAALLRHGVTRQEYKGREVAEQSVVDSAFRIVRFHPLDPRSPVFLRQLVRDLGPSFDLRKIIRAQIVKGLQTIASFPRQGEQTALRFRSVREAYESNHVAYWRALHRRLPDDPLDFATARRVIAETQTEFYPGGSFTLGNIAYVPLQDDVTNLARTEARRRMVLAIADVLEFRQRKGHWPQTLPKPYADPFGGHLRYSPEGDDFLIYSVGADFLDKGGAPEADIPFRLRE